MRNLLLFVLLACLGAFAQAPATIATESLNSDSLPDLGARIFWSPVSGATYSVYRYGNSSYRAICSDSKPHNDWEEVASGLTTTTYDDFPKGDQYGWGGEYCYSVTATVSGTESAKTIAPNEVIMGTSYYFLQKHGSPHCRKVTSAIAEGTLVLTRTRNGVSEAMPVIPLKSPINRWEGHFRLLSTDTISADLTLANGRTYHIPNVWLGGATDGSPLVANTSMYYTIVINSATGGFCSVTHWVPLFQHGSPTN